MSKLPNPPKNALLGDLESIRDLFDEADDEPETTSTPVPLLDEIVDDVVDEAHTADPQSHHADQAPGLDDDLFHALLGDTWRDSAARVLDQARDRIEDHREQWTPEDTDALNAALKVRIDETMQGWMRSLVVAHMADLHEAMLEMLTNELEGMIDEIIATRPGRGTKD